MSDSMYDYMVCGVWCERYVVCMVCRVCVSVCERCACLCTVRCVFECV